MSNSVSASHSASNALRALNTGYSWKRCVFSRRPKLAMLRSGSRRSLLRTCRKTCSS